MCGIQAATRFSLPANLVIAIAEQEGGRIGQWVKNANGSYDVGPMQLNTSYLKTLEHFGITPKDVEGEGCYAYELAAWRLRRHIDRDVGDVWTRISNYHSRTPKRNRRYSVALRARAAKWARWLSAHVPSIELNTLDELGTRRNLARASRENGKHRRVLHESPAQRHATLPLKQGALPTQRGSTIEEVNTNQENVINVLEATDVRRREQLLALATEDLANHSHQLVPRSLAGFSNASAAQDQR